jgi:hypothetical protein
MGLAMERASYNMKDTIDQDVASVMAAAVPSGNTLGTLASPKTDLATAGYPYNYLTELSVKLDEANVPSDGRFVIVPPWFHGLLQQDAKFVSSGSPQAEQRLTNGMIGQAAGFQVLKSNNVPNVSAAKYQIIAGHGMATTLAEQLTKVEALRLQTTIGDGVRGVWVWGRKVVRPTALAMLIANKPS